MQRKIRQTAGSGFLGMEFTALTPSHGDVVNDLAFDFYGKRFATCSSDKEIKVWDLVSDASASAAGSR